MSRSTSQDSGASVCDALLDFQHACAHYGHRGLLTIHGSLDFAIETLQSIQPILRNDKLLCISTQTLLANTRHLEHCKGASLLGSTMQCIVWNGFEGLSPNLIGASSGALEGGGLFVILLPETSRLLDDKDPDYSSMCSSDDVFSRCGNRYLQRLLDSFAKNPAHFSVSAKTQKLPELIYRRATPSSSRSWEIDKGIQLTTGQSRALSAIERVARGHRKRPLVLTADRGRGKTTLLGFAAKKLLAEDYGTVLITAPSKNAVTAALQVFAAHSPATPERKGQGLCFVPPDQLVSDLPECNLLIIDEAAGLPVPWLKKLTLHYPRVVFSSTIHGYEGAGQGFSVRLKHFLEEHRPQTVFEHLEEPVRWQSGDPLEACINHSLGLAASLRSASREVESGHISTRWIAQDELGGNEDLFQQLIALLVLAHYQTSPNDLRLLLDHPDVHVLGCFCGDLLVGAVMLIEEGNIPDKALQADVVSGTRRLKGHLASQGLASFNNSPELLALRAWRISRIVVHPDLKRKGLGTLMLSRCRAAGEEKKLDFISVSYGITSSLLHFWHQNRYRLLRVGYQQDHVSGTHSGLAWLALSRSARACEVDFAKRFTSHYYFNLARCYQDMSWKLVLTLLERADSLPDQFFDMEILSQFGLGKRNEFDSTQEICALWHSPELQRRQALSTMEEVEKALLVMRCFQNLSWQKIQATDIGITGKKQGLQKLRSAVSKLINTLEN